MKMLAQPLQLKEEREIELGTAQLQLVLYYDAFLWQQCINICFIVRMGVFS
jgi:hypothetical protein